MIMGNKITVTFNDGSRKVLKSPDTLQSIDEKREARFVMDKYAEDGVMVRLMKMVTLVYLEPFMVYHFRLNI